MARYISSQSQLQNIAMDDDVALSRSITLDTGFTGIGTESAPFTGKFDGNGHLIDFPTDLTANGIFNYVGGNAEIYNVNVRGGSISSGSVAGSVIGTVVSGGSPDMKWCTSSAQMSSGCTYSGGLVGRVFGSLSMTECTYHGYAVQGICAGGLVGKIEEGGSIGLIGCGVGFNSQPYNAYGSGTYNEEYTGAYIHAVGSSVANAFAGGLVGVSSGTVNISDCYVDLGEAGSISATRSTAADNYRDAGGLLCLSSSGSNRIYDSTVYSSKGSAAITAYDTTDALVNTERVTGGAQYYGRLYYTTGICEKGSMGTSWSLEQFAVVSNYPSTGFSFKKSSGVSASSVYWEVVNGRPRVVPKKHFTYIRPYNTDIDVNYATVDRERYNTGEGSRFVTKKSLFVTTDSSVFYKWNTKSNEAGTYFNQDMNYAVPDEITDSPVDLDLRAVVLLYFTLTYNGGGFSGTVPSPSSVLERNTVTTSSSLSRTGYDLTGWKRSDTSEVILPGGTFTMPAANVTLTAQWTKHTYSIAYSLNGGTAGGSAPTSGTFSDTDDGIISMTISNPTKKGYTFAGWTTSGIQQPYAVKRASSSDAWASWDGTATTNQYFANLTYVQNAVVTLTATWTQITYYIGYDLADGTFGQYYPTSATYEQIIRISNPTKVGYTFLGWYISYGVDTSTKQTGVSGYDSSMADWDGTDTKNEYFRRLSAYLSNFRSVMLAAHWSENTYNIRYDYALGSAGSYAPTSANFSSTVRISNPVRAGFTFTGWQASNITTDTAKRGTSSPASTAWDGTATTDQYFQGLNKNNEYTVTLTAVWRVNRFNIAYVLDGGTGTGPASADCGSPFYIPYPTKANYVFGGWTAANLTTASSKAGQSSGQLSAWDGTKNVGPYFQDLNTADGATVTLTAVWQGESRTITVKASPIDKGTVSGGGVYEYNTSCTISASPTGTNVFIGWYKGGQLVSSRSSFTFTVTEDATYSAYFEVSASTKLVLRASPTFDIVLGNIAMYSVSSSRVHNSYSIGEGGDVAEMSGNVDESGNTNVFIKRGSLSPGYHRIQVMATSGSPVQTASVTTELFVSLPDVDTVMDRWRFVIFRSDGSYVAVSDLIHGVLASVMPEVRLEKNAPSKAVIQLTCPRGTNVRSSSFSGWSNGVAGPISEGQFLAVDYLDDGTGTVVRRFCGTIRKAENAGTRVTLTAYDRLMELYEKADPYQIFGGIANDQRSRNRAVGTGDTYGFTMWDLIASGGILAISFVDLENINTFYDYRQGLVYPEASERISEIGYRMTAAYGHIRRVRVHAAPSAHPGGGYEYGVGVGVRLYECNQNTGRPISLISDTGWHYVDATADPYNTNLEIYANWDVIVGKKYFISAYYICDDPTDDNLAYRYRAGLESTPYTFRRKRDSSVWISGGIPKGPDAYYVGIGIEYEKIRSSDSYASSASLGTDRHIIVCPTRDVAPTDNPTLEGIAIYATYIIDSSASVTGKSVSVIVSELVERAGLKPSLTGEDDDSRRISFYNSSSYDYLSAIQELVQSAGYDGTSYFLRGVQDDPSMPGCIRIGRLALPDASASGMAVTTDPYADGVHDVASHSLKRTFEEEVTAPIVLSQDTTDDSPIAIQTDDRLFSDSKIAEFGHEYVKIYTDNTLQDHTMLALSAESMVRKIHYNALEGDMELVGLYPSMWDIGGRCLKVDIPEYGADSYAVPSIMVLGSYRTAMTMDNVRSDNRSALYSTMTQSSDAQSYTVSGIGDASYIFLRSPSLLTLTGTVTVEILGRDGTSLGSTMTVKRVSDRASDAAGKGYDHVAALFPKSSSGYAPGNTYVKYVRISTPTAGESYTLLVPNPVYGWPGQYIHIDVRMPN